MSLSQGQKEAMEKKWAKQAIEGDKLAVECMSIYSFELSMAGLTAQFKVILPNKMIQYINNYSGFSYVFLQEDASNKENLKI